MYMKEWNNNNNMVMNTQKQCETTWIKTIHNQKKGHLIIIIPASMPQLKSKTTHLCFTML